MTLQNTDSETGKNQSNTDKPLSFNPGNRDELGQPVWFEKVIEKLSELGD
jgi:hypothetical protein